MKNLLVLSAHPPLIRSKEAGQKVFFDFLSKLSKEFNIYLLTFIREEEYGWGLEECNRICEEVYTIEITFREKIYNVLKNPFYPALFSARKKKEFQDRIDEITKEKDFVWVHFEWEQMIQYFSSVKDIKYKTVTCHDVVSQMYHRKVKKNINLNVFNRIQLNKVTEIERVNLPKFDTVFTLNEKDSNLLTKINNNIITKELHPYFNMNSNYNSTKNYDLVFFGALNRIENENGILWFLKKIYPNLKSINKDINLLIIGNNPSNKIKKFALKDNSIKVTGFVEDPYHLISQSRVGIVPLFLGAGIKIKTLEFMSNKIPVVCTDVGAEGINASDKEGMLVRNTADEFISTIKYLLDNPLEAKKLGEEAQKFIQKNYKYDHNTEVLRQIYSDVYIKGAQYEK